MLMQQRAGAVAQWSSACLPCTKSREQSSALGKCLAWEVLRQVTKCVSSLQVLAPRVIVCALLSCDWQHSGFLWTSEEHIVL